MFDTAEQHKIRVSVVTKGLSHPWAIAFLPGGEMLITERGGRLRVVRDGVLDPKPIPACPRSGPTAMVVSWMWLSTPRFTENRLVYLTYTKPVGNGMGAPAFARGRLEAARLSTSETFLSPIRTRATPVSTAASSSDVTVRSTCPPAAGRKTTLRTLRKIP